MRQHRAPAPGQSGRDSKPLASTEAPIITWEWLHGAVAAALRRIEPGAPLYVTADVLTDELLPPLKEVHRPGH
ncbi:hypothetical protein GCM10009712_17340 [Pseudarthrobacter sulfonivorans]|uniref:hypothetical protein n=1 Tax=Pseudarthrobacter sulfonivorans TaxID=121292 RepID=UPI00168A7953|nr:hypothetical protein [Pseudarthrobacter sulfonivorans]